MNQYVHNEMMCVQKQLTEANRLIDSKKLLDKPHRKTRLYYVDEYGNILDPDGYVCYTDGTRVTVKADEI